MRDYYVYIITNKPKGVLYTGITNNLERRMWEHKTKQVKGFSQTYCLDKLIWYEHTNDVNEAISREKQIKNWKRQWKIELIEEQNPNWRDLSGDFELEDI